MVRGGGGWADTVVGGSGDADLTSTGFVFDAATPAALAQAVQRALQLRRDQPAAWAARVQRAMAQRLGWGGPARQYLALYEAVRTRRRGPPGN